MAKTRAARSRKLQEKVGELGKVDVFHHESSGEVRHRIRCRQCSVHGAHHRVLPRPDNGNLYTLWSTRWGKGPAEGWTFIEAYETWLDHLAKHHPEYLANRLTADSGYDGATS